MAEPVTDGDDYALHRQLAVVDDLSPISQRISNSDSSSITPFSSPFSLPDGWVVHKVLRSDGIRVDKYYIEPEAGRRFRSKIEVKRYLNVEEYKATKSSPLRLEYRIKSDRKMIASGVQMTPKTLKFILPENWFVEKVPRKSGGTIDKYYHDPETGRKFRSLKDVERYLTEERASTGSSTKRQKYHEKDSQSCGSQKKIVSNGKMLNYEEEKDNQYQLVNVTPTSFPSISPSILPDGWIVEEVPRKTSVHIDRYYYEPGTGQKFRSLIAAQKHLAEMEENSPLSVVLAELKENNLPLSKAFKLSSSIKNHGSYDSWKKSISRKEQATSIGNPPMKINWVIAGETWNAFVDDSLVSDRLKQQWGKSFMFAINNTKQSAPISG